MWDLVAGMIPLYCRAARLGFVQNKFFWFRIVPMPVGSCHKIGRPSRPGRSLSEGVGDFMQIGCLSDIYLLPFSHSVLATLNQMDKPMEMKASEEKMLLISSKDKGEHFLFSLSFNIAMAIFFFFCAQRSKLANHFWDWLEHLNKDFPCYAIESNINLLPRHPWKRNVQAMVQMLCLPEASHVLCSWAPRMLSEFQLGW